MKGAGFRTILVTTAVLSLAACGKRDSLYLDHNREEAKAPGRKPAPSSALANTTATNAPAQTTTP